MFEESALLIEQRLSAGWITTPIDFDNVPYTPVIGTAFVRLQIEWIDGVQTSIGGRVQGSGYVDISIFTPAGTGSRTAAQMADSLAVIFNRYQTGGLRFKIGHTERVGQQEEWFQLKLIIPFTYDFCITT